MRSTREAIDKGHATDAARASLSLRWHIWTAWAAFAAIALSATRADPDLWGHMRFGLDWFRTHTLPRADPYSFMQDRPWTNHEWLSEVIMAGAYRLAGAPGLVLLKVGVIGSALAVLVWRVRHSSAIVSASIVSLAIISALPLSGTIRPQIWSVLGLALLIPLLDVEREPKLIHAAGAAALFAIWANLHGGWITGAAVLATHAGVRVARAPRHAAGWLLLFGLALAATLLNPYGIDLWRFLAATVRTSRPDITEWQPFSLHEPPIMWVSIVVPLGIAAVLSRRRETRPPPEVLVVLLLLLAAGVHVSRVAPLVAPSTLILLAPWMQQAWGRYARLTVPTPSAAGMFAVPVIVALAAAATPVARALNCIPISDSWAPDRTAAARLRGASGRLWTTFDWGEYAIWHFGPQLRVSIDGRRETVYSDDVVQWHRAFERGNPHAQARFSTIMPEYVWLRSGRAAAREWLKTHGYRLDAETGASFVATRADVPRLRVAAEPLPACFP